MSDERRFFRGRDRLGLFLRAGGKCQTCGVELERGWHADHVYPFSKGGGTNLGNGQALCPSCNQGKGDRVNRRPRDWQTKAFEAWGRKRTFMLAACPGSGKTQFALTCADDLARAGQISLTIFVVPRTSLVNQVCSAAHEIFGVKYVPLKNDHPMPPRDADGIVVTYQQVAELPSIYADLSADQFVVFDEAHHMADEGDWGSKSRFAFEGSAYKLLTTGTPWRTDGRPIPFVEFDAKAELRSDYDYLFSDAWADPQCPIRNISVNRIDADGIWSFDDAEAVHSVKGSLLDPASKEEGTWLRACYGPGDDWVRLAFEQAQRALTVAKATYPEAQGLWIADSISKAEAYSEYLDQLGISHSVVHGNVPRPHDALAAFPKSSNEWCIAVDMVSEGVDNPKFAVLLFSSRKTTEMYFQQACGRVIRKASADDELTAQVFVPDSPTFRQHINNLDEQRVYALQEKERREAPIAAELQKIESHLRIHGSENAEETGSTLKGRADLEQRKQDLIERIQQIKDPNALAAAEELLPQLVDVPQGSETDSLSPSDRAQLRSKRQKLVAQISDRHRVDHSEINNKMARLFGHKNKPWAASPYERVQERSDDDLRLEVDVLLHWRDTGIAPRSLRLDRV